MAKREYSSETKAAVMAALLTGQAVGEIAEQYNIPSSTIRSWQYRQRNNDGVAVVATQKKEEIGDLLVDYIRASLQALKIQVEHFADKSWLTAQDADQLAVLHGVQADKAIRLLEALSSTDGDE